jgi:hypothetical protein
MNAQGFYESYFSPYLAFGDEAIHQFSYWQAIKTTSTFPIREVFVREAFTKKYKVSKQANEPDSSEENYSAGANGEFELVPMSPTPYGDVHREVQPEGMNSNILDPNIPAIRYINPDINIAKYSGESWEKLIEKAEQALNIDMTVGLSQSGIAKQIDKEAQYSMITKIGNNFFDNIYKNSLKIIDGYLNMTSFEKSGCTIAKPTTFWVKTEVELTAEITVLKTSNAPSFFLSEATLELAKKRFNGDPVKEKVFEVIALYDPLYTDTDAEKSNKLVSGIITKEDYINSVRMFSILSQIVKEKTPDRFMSMSHGEIFEEFQSMVEEFYPESERVEYDDN